MILYYSATGNTEFVAKEIAERLDDQCLNLLERIKTQDFSPIHSDRPFIICAPVIVCEMPRFMDAYLKKVPLTGSKDVYFIFTSGGYAGISGVLSKSLVKKKNMTYHGHAEVTMPRNYVANNHYTMLSHEEAKERIVEAYGRLDGIADDIKCGRPLTARHIALWESIVTIPFNPVWVKYKLTSKDFFTTDACIGCGKCEKVCPLNNIQIKGKAPVWGSNCTHCMACISHCPTRAIEYGNMTQEKEPHNFKNFQYVIDELKNK